MGWLLARLVNPGQQLAPEGTMSQKGMKPGENMPGPEARPPAPCPECLAEGKVRWTDANGDLKAKVCPRCHGSGLETTTPPPTANPRTGTYHTK